MTIAKHTQDLCELFEKGEEGIDLGYRLLEVQEELGYSDNEINFLADLVLAGNDLDMCISMFNTGIADLDTLHEF